MKKMIATMMLLLTINISNVAADEQENSSKPTRIEMDKSNLSGDEFERSISLPIIEATLYTSINAIEVILYNTCCTPKDKSEFYLNLKRNHDIKNINFIPKHKLGSCSATNENSYLIDPEGYLYKCWNDIGLSERRVGSVFEGITNNTLIAKYIIGSDKYTDSNCLSCSLFPICDGGCNRHRMDNIEQNTCYNLCPFDENGIEEYLYEYYKSK